MRKKFATQYGFVVPEIKVIDDMGIADKSYQIRIHGTTIASNMLRVGEVLVVTGSGRKPTVPGDGFANRLSACLPSRSSRRSPRI